MSGDNLAADTVPEDYSILVAGNPVASELPFIVGGQGVNFWALYFLKSERALSNYKPYASKDCDVVADQEWIRKIIAKTRFRYKTYKAGIASPEIGVIFVPLGNGEAILPVLRSIRGVHPQQLEERALLVTVGSLTYNLSTRSRFCRQRSQTFWSLTKQIAKTLSTSTCFAIACEPFCEAKLKNLKPAF